MEDLICIASDNSATMRDDLISWLYYFYRLHPEYSDWNFDDITGGKDNFIDLAEYEEVKEFLKKHTNK